MAASTLVPMSRARYTSAYLTYALLGLSGPLTMTQIAPASGVKAEGSRPSYEIGASFQPMP